MTFFQEELFPMVKALDMGMVQDEIPQWEQKMERVRYGWREYYRHGDYCGLNPDRYETQAEFVRELDRRRNAKWAAEDEQRKKEMAWQRKVKTMRRFIFTAVWFSMAARGCTTTGRGTKPWRSAIG